MPSEIPSSPDEAASDPIVTVVITTRNRLSFLKEAIESVVRQSVDWELIIVDDQSTDGTWAWLANQPKDTRWQVVRQSERRERGAARNVGLARATGKYALFLDDDDQLAPGALETLVAAMERHPRAVGTGAGRVEFGDGAYHRPEIPVRRELVRDISTDLVYGWFLVPGCVLWRTDALRQSGAWNEQLTVSEDHELELRLSRLGPWVLVPDVVLHYRAHVGQTRPSEAQAHCAERHLAQQIAAVAAHLGRSTEGLLRAWGLMWLADQAFRARRPRQTLAAYGRAVVAVPAVMASPLLRPVVVRRTAWAVAHLADGWRPARRGASRGRL